MSSIEQLSHLTSAVQAFTNIIESLSTDLFLRKIDAEWTPRDVVAHLAWWNRNMIAACKNLQAGVPPAYYADTANDYRNINTQAIAEFSSRDQRKLLEQLQSTHQEFEDYLRALDESEWNAARNIMHYRGGAATINRIVESLISDYASHTRQVKEWLEK